MTQKVKPFKLIGMFLETDSHRNWHEITSRYWPFYLPASLCIITVCTLILVSPLNVLVLIKICPDHVTPVSLSPLSGSCLEILMCFFCLFVFNLSFYYSFNLKANPLLVKCKCNAFA